jgi:ABC-type sugar transport system substrate-binding protein
MRRRQFLAGAAALSVARPVLAARAITLGFAHVALNNPYYIAMEKAATDTAQKLGARLLIRNAKGEVLVQNEQINELIDAGVNGLVVNSATEYGTMAAIKRAKEKGIPVVAIDRPLYGDYLAYVGIDQWRAGTLQGEYIATELLPQGGNIVMLLGVPGEPATIGRGNGMLNVIQHPKFAGRYNVLASYRADYNMELGYQKTVDAIGRFGGKINLIYALNDAMALGALKALGEADLKQVMVAGIDGQKEAYAEIMKENSAYRSTVINNPSEITRRAVELLADALINGHQPEKRTIITGTVLVTRDNVAKYFDPTSVF